MSDSAKTRMTNIGHEFEDYLRLFWYILSRLAREGYAAPPNEALDLIHDFYADAWSQVLQNFDPSKGVFESYIGGAFYRFARRKIIHQRHQKARVVQLSDDLIGLEDQPHELVSRNESMQEIRGIAETLPELERIVLWSYVENPRTARRITTRQHKITRYRFNESLTNALGRIAVQIGHLPDGTEIDRQAATYFWREGLDARTTAALLGVSTKEANAARQRIVSLLVKGLRSGRRASVNRSLNMDNLSIVEIKKMILSGNQNKLSNLKAMSDRIIAALKDGQLSFTEKEEESLDENWLAALYADFADEAPLKLSGKEETIRTELQKIRDSEESEIGEAFSILLEGLHERFANWDHERFFGNVPHAQEVVQAAIRKDPAFLKAQPYSDGLVKYGMTPLTFVAAARGIQLLLDRLTWMSSRSVGDLPVSEDVAEYLSWLAEAGSEMRFNLCIDGETESIHPVLPRHLLLDQIEGTPNLHRNAAEPMTRWIIAVAQRRPLFISNYAATTICANTVQLVKYTDAQEMDIVKRWQQTASVTATHE